MLNFTSGSHAQRILSIEEQREDFNQFREELVKRNRGLFLFLDEQDFNQLFDHFYEQIDRERTEIEFYELLKETIVPIQERHLSIKGFHKSSETSKKFEKGEYKVIPLAIRFENDSTAHIIRNISKDSTIQLPSQLLSINNLPVSKIHDSISNYIIQDKGVNTWKNWEMSRTFPLQYFIHVDTTSTFKLTWKDSLNNEQISEVYGVSTKFYTDSVERHSKELLKISDFKPGFRTHFYDSLSTAYLKLSTFSKRKLKTGEDKFLFKQTVKNFFSGVEEKGHKNVIIDLRNNTGGKVDYVKFLLAFVQENEEKIPIYYSERERKYWCGLSKRVETTKKQKSDHFDGELYILTNGGSYSASVMFTNFAKQLADATIVGEEAGGRFDGTSAGRFKRLKLDHSKIVTIIPEAIYDYYINNDVLDSLEPDIKVEAKIEDYFSYDHDHQLNTLLKIIELKQGEHKH